ncbi:MAG: AI-2E family transporter [Firmicutes bacterium]|nr:AI-2E family transporter [Bacillota bacterium]MDY5856428.1 AI-2E family transporter [Anaerovoracaceae bacterium]
MMEEKSGNGRKGSFREALLLILIGVGAFVGLSHLDIVGSRVWSVIRLFMPLIIGGIVAFILNVPMHFFEKQCDRLSGKKGLSFLRHGRGPVCLILTLLLFVLVIIFISSVIFPNLADSIGTLISGVLAEYPKWLDYLQAHHIDTSAVENALNRIDIHSVLGKIQENLGMILSAAVPAVGNAVGILADIGFGLIFAIYILLNKKKLGVQAKKIAYAYLKKSWADEICDIASLAYKTFSSFLSGQCLEAVILGAMFCIVLLIGGFPSAITIGVIIGAMALIPFIGAFIGLVFGILLILVETPAKVLWFIVIFFVVQQIEGNLIYPRVVGGSVGLPPIWTLLAVVVGGSVSGIFGIVAFIPLFSVLYALLRRSVYSRLRKKKIRITE